MQTAISIDVLSEQLNQALSKATDHHNAANPLERVDYQWTGAVGILSLGAAKCTCEVEQDEIVITVSIFRTQPKANEFSIAYIKPLNNQCTIWEYSSGLTIESKVRLTTLDAGAQKILDLLRKAATKA